MPVYVWIDKAQYQELSKAGPVPERVKQIIQEHLDKKK